MLLDDLFCLILGFSATYLFVPFSARLARCVGAMDVSVRGGRLTSIPRLGGLAIALGLLVATLPFLADRLPELPFGRGTLAGFFLILGLGITDDVWSARPLVKLGAQLVAAGLFVGDGWHIDHLTGAGSAFELGPLAGPLSIFFLVGAMNAWNLIDGLDGLATSLALLVSLTFLAVASAAGQVAVAASCAGLAGALSAFQRFNRSPASIFLGDTGSLFIGTTLGLAALKITASPNDAISLALPILAMVVPIADTAIAIVRRTLRGVSWARPDQEHLHHRLLREGFSPSATVGILQGATVAGCLAGVGSLRFGELSELTYAASIALAATLLLAWCSRRFAVGGRAATAWVSTFVIATVLLAAASGFRGALGSLAPRRAVDAKWFSAPMPTAHPVDDRGSSDR